VSTGRLSGDAEAPWPARGERRFFFVALAVVARGVVVVVLVAAACSAATCAAAAAAAWRAASAGSMHLVPDAAADACAALYCALHTGLSR